ncbi:MAG TPA: endonuclease/exonuclease/phosphatase family protein [Intrasporangium sp.]|uniref:endonuclease/exonuclease/phosphatase family protein n=1 Tax=Intrasporangium sp. TaxID=1925024 RepID=UPI002D78FC78|nr:endonuclease/exonuclease/phosphatase family protein [Intrasporangium sp.]HET7399800.1 endonuclease/exonuclease/phosphatase family protein [Intrasporangium sp.]
MRHVGRLFASFAVAMALAALGLSGPASPPAAWALTPGPIVAQFNMCGGNDCSGTPAQKVGWIASTVIARQARVLTLNEVCGNQLSVLTDRLRAGGYAMQASFMATVPAGGSRCAGTAYGNAVLTRTTQASVRRHVFAAQDGGAQKRAVLCVLTQLARASQVCTTHLSPGPRRAAVRDRQVAETVAFARLVSRPTLLMGDLNDYPASDSFDRVYAPSYGGGATGAYVEGGSTRGGLPCRCGAPTRGSTKIDYVFASGSAFGPGTSQTIDAPYSDHHLLLARPVWR